jgi:hypothetical protein
MSAVIPPNLNEVFRNLSGFRKSLIRFYADRSGEISASDVLRWTLPKEILLMDTLMHYFEIKTTHAGTNTAQEKRASCFPRNSASIIDTITVFINGQVFENIPSYNHLFNLIYDNTCGYNYYNSGLRALECSDPSIKYAVADASGNAITGTVQGALNTSTSETTVCENWRPLQIRNWIGFLGSCNKVLDLTNVEVVIEIRYAPATILFLGVDVGATGKTSATPTYKIDKYYFTAQKISFDDDYYNIALNSLKSSGNYVITFKTYSFARGPQVDKTNNPNIQFSSTSKYLTKLYFTMLDGTFDTQTTIQNTDTTKSYSQHLADLKTNVDVFNQSKFFKKTAVSLTEAQVEINGLPIYPFPQQLHLIKNNNIEALDMENNNLAADYVGLQSLESWSKYAFLMATSFEMKDAYKNGIISGFPNPNANLLNIKYQTTFASTATDKVYLCAWAEKVVKCIFVGSSVQIDM